MRNPIQEQNDGMVSLDGSGRALPILNAFANSSAVYWFGTQVPYEGIFLKVGNEDKTGWIASCKATFHASCRMYRVYVGGRNFPKGCETVYQVMAVDDNGARHVCGEGKLRIARSAIDEHEASRECMAKFPDGEWRKVTVTEDEAGAPIFKVGEVAEEPPKDERDLYAWDNSRGFFFKVVGLIDEVGVRILALDQEPLGDGAESFAFDDATGFYRRVEAEMDESGAETLVVGEKV